MSLYYKVYPIERQASIKGLMLACLS